MLFKCSHRYLYCDIINRLKPIVPSDIVSQVYLLIGTYLGVLFYARQPQKPVVLKCISYRHTRRIALY